jgi:hypothetical protein
MSRISDKLAAAAIRKATNTNPDHALINQLGEALLIHERKEVDNPAQVVLEARAAYNNWKRERGE